MNNILKYRIVAVALVVVFGVFNIGIPIIIASCSMPEMMRGSYCPMCDDQELPSGARFTTQNAVCCTASIVAERNTTEFVQGKTSVSDLGKLVLVVSPADVIPVPILQSPVPVVYQITSSPPAVADIPIFNSSLLI